MFTGVTGVSDIKANTVDVVFKNTTMLKEMKEYFEYGVFKITNCKNLVKSRVEDN